MTFGHMVVLHFGLCMFCLFSGETPTAHRTIHLSQVVSCVCDCFAQKLLHHWLFIPISFNETQINLHCVTDQCSDCTKKRKHRGVPG
uniref:Secreted protein n=1 Tax=Pyxicephalus adspersus TaxID=30357 RepID=A0AAV3A592_PYXAD|nr:TPA: hypothetical protein GDO54_018373 [Pyxicephalus adspersus]